MMLDIVSARLTSEFISLLAVTDTVIRDGLGAASVDFVTLIDPTVSPYDCATAFIDDMADSSESIDFSMIFVVETEQKDKICWNGGRVYAKRLGRLESPCATTQS